MKEEIKKSLALLTAICLCLGFTGCNKKTTKSTVEKSAIVSTYNNDFETSKLPKLTKEQAENVHINKKITYYDILKIIEDVNKNKQTDEITKDKYLKALKVNEAYDNYIVARKERQDLSKIRKAMGELDERLLFADILQLYQIDPEQVKSVKIKDNWFNEYSTSGENYEGKIITVTFKENKQVTTKPGGIIEEEVQKETKKNYYLSLSRTHMKRINKLKAGTSYNLDELDKTLTGLLYGLCSDPSIEHFHPTPWGEKNFQYLIYVLNEEIYSKVQSLSYVLEQNENNKTDKISQLKDLKAQALKAKVAMKSQNYKTLNYNVNKNIPRRG